MSKEKWKPVPGTSFYFVSDRGRLYSTKVNRVLNVNPRKDGYCKTLIYLDGKPKNIAVHSLVLLTFVGPRPEGYVIRHLDGNSANNQLSNLAYGTAKENALDTIRHGTHQWAKRDCCKNGHEYTEQNTYVWYRNGSPRRHCKTCRETYRKRYETRNRI